MDIYFDDFTDAGRADLGRAREYKRSPRRGGFQRVRASHRLNASLRVLTAFSARCCRSRCSLDLRVNVPLPGKAGASSRFMLIFG